MQVYRTADQGASRGIALLEVPQRSGRWLDLIRDHVATSLSIEPDDFDYAPFTQRGGLGKAASVIRPAAFLLAGGA
jgi:hypothetical protein